MPNDINTLPPETPPQEITPVLRIYTEQTSDTGGIWDFKPWAFRHVCWVPEQDYHAALDRAEPAATVKVKPLVWQDIAPHHSKAALPLFGNVRAESWGGDFSVVWSVPGMCDTFTEGKWPTLEAAKAAAQADYEARILTSLQNPQITPRTDEST